MRESATAAEMGNFTTIAFRWPAGLREFDLRHGLPFLRRLSARSSLLASVSRYKVCATAAGPRISLNCNTSTSKSPLSFFTVRKSPHRTSRAAFAGCSLLVIRPSPQARAANARVLKNRAAHNHLSMRTESTLHFATLESACWKLAPLAETPRHFCPGQTIMGSPAGCTSAAAAHL